MKFIFIWESRRLGWRLGEKEMSDLDLMGVENLIIALVILQEEYNDVGVLLEN